MNKELKQLKFRCEHRGMREMDMLMGGFFDMFKSEFSSKDIFQIEKYIIPLSDNDLYLVDWFIWSEINLPTNPSITTALAAVSKNILRLINLDLMTVLPEPGLSIFSTNKIHLINCKQ